MAGNLDFFFPTNARHVRNGAALVTLILPSLFGASAAIGTETAASFRGKIVCFGNSKDDHRLIETMSLDGTELATVVDLDQAIDSDRRFVIDGRVAPDGSRAVFAMIPAEEQRAQLWLVSPQGQTEMILENGGKPTAWSPDGRQITFYWGTSGKWDCQTVDVAARSVKRFDIAPTDVVEDWSPDGAELTVMAGNIDRRFTRRDGEIYPLRGLYFAKVDGTRLAPLTSDPDGDFIWPRYSPDGRKLAYYQRRHSNGRTFESCVVANRDGSNPRELVCFSKLAEDREVRPAGSPCWSPDGTAILWRLITRPRGSDDNGEFELAIVAADGSGVRRMQLNQGRQWWGSIDCR